jgi:hypothetical protein
VLVQSLRPSAAVGNVDSILVYRSGNVKPCIFLMAFFVTTRQALASTGFVLDADGTR